MSCSMEILNFLETCETESRFEPVCQEPDELADIIFRRRCPIQHLLPNDIIMRIIRESTQEQRDWDEWVFKMDELNDEFILSRNQYVFDERRGVLFHQTHMWSSEEFLRHLDEDNNGWDYLGDDWRFRLGLKPFHLLFFGEHHQNGKDFRYVQKTLQ